jgi:penicillin-binding protein 2
MTDNSRVRVTIVGVVIVALFCSLVARLWFLQMGPEQKLRAEAIALSTRKIQTQTPRGRILDRNGVVLAQDRAAWALTIDRSLKPARRQQVIGQLSELLGVKESDLQAAYDSPRQSPLLPAVVKLDVPLEQRLAILERPDDYPGVHVALLTVREYPEADKLRDPTLASQVLGYVGEINREQLDKLKSKGYQAGDLIGRDGVEAAYESVLRGTPEIKSVSVDPTGKQVGASTIVQDGSVGDDVQLTIDAKIQHSAEMALQAGIDRARTLQDDTYKAGYRNYKAPGGAVLVLDVHSGGVVAMASYPSFPPSAWVGGIGQGDFSLITNPASAYPLVNRATQGQYAPGSTFKLVTSLAEQRYGIRGPADFYDDTGSVLIGADKVRFSNDTGGGNGEINLPQALTVSSDTYFYTAGNDFWTKWASGDALNGLGLQQEARDLGFGSKTGIELDEATGRVPDPTWKKNFADSYYKNAQDKKANGQWYPGDEVHLATGQGDLLVTPLQLADAYAAFANGGTLLTPHIAATVRDPRGKVLQLIAPKPRAKLSFDPATYQAMMTGFEGVVQSSRPLGTAYDAFAGFPESAVPGGVAGKTGTAQVAGKAPTSVFAGFFPAAAPQYVVLALVEEAGHGANIAAPIVRQVIESMLNLPQTPITPATPRGKD